MTSVPFGHDAGGHGSGNTGYERSELDDAVSPGQPIFGKQLRKQAVLRRSEESRFYANQKNGSTFHGQIFKIEREDGEGHDEEFEEFGADGDAAFAVAVSKVSAGHGE